MTRQVTRGGRRAGKTEAARMGRELMDALNEVRKMLTVLPHGSACSVASSAFAATWAKALQDAQDSGDVVLVAAMRRALRGHLALFERLGASDQPWETFRGAVDVEVQATEGRG